MKLHYSGTSPYVRKVMACAIARGLDGRIEKHISNPHASPADLLADNPLSRVPCLVTDDGLSLYDSPVICEWALLKISGFHRSFSIFRQSCVQVRCLALSRLLPRPAFTVCVPIFPGDRSRAFTPPPLPESVRTTHTASYYSRGSSTRSWSVPWQCRSCAPACRPSR